jgi:hypothetical protein
MQSRSRESHFLRPTKKRPLRRFLKPPLETWALVVVLIVIMVLSAIALGACWDSLSTDQAIGLYHLSAGFVC